MGSNPKGEPRTIGGGNSDNGIQNSKGAGKEVKNVEPQKVCDGVETPSHEEEPHRTEEPAEDKTELNKNAPKGDYFD